MKAGPRALGLVVSLALLGLLAGVFGGSAAAAPIAKNGRISACYKVKGKPKGAMRVVPTGRKCRKGERKLAWNVAGPAGANGQNGVGGMAGAAGSPGPAGPAGSPGAGNEAALEAKVADLTLQLEGLEGILAGLTNADLVGAVDKLDGITGLQLTETVGALPVVSSLCTQAAALPGQINTSLGNALSGLALGGTIPTLLSLTVPSLTPVTSYACPN